jgi:N-acetyl sugar amidotransferase
LLKLHRGKYGKYDCIVPGSGGKDSCYASHVLKYKYGMSPLTVTWPPIMYTNYGYQNFINWLKYGKFENISAKRSVKDTQILTRLAVLNLLHPFQPFILGQKNYPIRIAMEKKIPLIFYGENEAEHGNPISDNNTSLKSKSQYTYENLDEIYLGGVNIKELKNKYNIEFENLKNYLPPTKNELGNFPLEIHYLGYYLNWVPQETYYYSVKNCKFRPRPFRTQGTYSKYNSIDDKIDDLHFYTLFIKFGIGRATYDVSQELRNDHLTVEEGKKLIGKYDGEFPTRYFSEIMKFLKISKSQFLNLLDNFRSEHLWKKYKNEWVLRHNVNNTGYDD